MSVFISNGMVKSINLLLGFCLSFLFAVVHVLAYMFTSELVTIHASAETGGFLQVWLPPFLISLAAAIPCCCLILTMKRKLAVPLAYTLFAVYYFLFLAVINANPGNELEALLLTQVLSIYLFPPTVAGNLLSWGIYLLLYRKKNTRQQDSLWENPQ